VFLQVTPIAVTDKPFLPGKETAPIAMYDLHIYTGPTAGPKWGYFTDRKNWEMLENLPRNASQGKEPGSPPTFMLQLITLPRQARDKHRDNSNEGCVLAVFLSEYAAGVSQHDGGDPTQNCDAKFPGGPHLSQGGLGNVQAAVHEAVWMTAMERNGAEQKPLDEILC